MQEVIEKTKKTVEMTKAEVVNQTVTLINGAFALVAALAWNDAIKALLEKVFSQGANLISKFLYAFIITLVVVIFTKNMKKFEIKTEEQNK